MTAAPPPSLSDAGGAPVHAHAAGARRLRARRRAQRRSSALRAGLESPVIPTGFIANSSIPCSQAVSDVIFSL
jgi:hypothetical protein